MSNTQPRLVSVIITHYNRPEFIARAVNSVMQEPEMVGEVIVVDDCSTPADAEAAAQVVAKYSQARIIRHSQNQGANSARNTGIEASRFDYVAFLDGDDEWHPGKLRRQISFMEEAGLDFSATQFREISADRSRVLPKRSLGKLDVASYIFLFGGHFSTTTLVVRANVAKRVRFKEGLRKFQDWEYAIRLHSVGFRGDVLLSPLATYHTEHGNRISSNIRIDLAHEFYDGVCHLIPVEAALAFRLRALPRMHVKTGRLFQGLGVALAGLFRHRRGIVPLVAHAIAFARA